jgi:hypothetical protein
MRATVTIDDALLDRAIEPTGPRESSVLMRLGLETLIER